MRRLVLASLLAAAPSAAAAAEGDPALALERYRLPNGLEVILHPDKTVPLAYVSVWYHVASGDETPGKSGFAHLFEHMMFQGSKHVGEDKHFDVLKKVGASSINGSTNPDRTNYFEQVPSNQLGTALWLESDRMGYMLPLLTEKSLANQRDVVRNERRQNYDNVPYGKERFALSRLLYAEGHPYRYLTIGRHEDLAQASLEDVKSFFRKWYIPSNATLLIAGDIDVPATKALVTKWFGSFPSSERPAHRTVPPTPITQARREVVNDEMAKLRRVHYAWHSPAAFAPGDAELEILASVLGNQGTGRLFKTLVHEKQWAQEVSVYQAGQGMSGTFNVIVDLKPDADAMAVEAAMDDEIFRVMKEPVSERERKRVITEIEATFVRGLETLLGRGERVQHYNHYLGQPDGFTRELDSYRNATVAAVRDKAAAYLKKQNRVEVITMPARATATAARPPAEAPMARPKPPEPAAPELVFPEEPFRDKQPDTAPERPFKAPALVRFSLPSGPAVYLIERHNLPIVSMTALFEGGSRIDPKGKEGLGAVCADLLTDGTAKLDRIAFAEAQADIAATLTSGSSEEQHWVSLNAMKRNLGPSLDLFADVLTQTNPRKEELERNLKRRIARLAQIKGSPATLAQRLYGSVAFGAGHAFGRMETEPSLGTITGDDCPRFIADHVKPQGARLFVVGDITKDELIKEMEARLKDWKGKPKAVPAVGKPNPRAGRIFFVDVPAAPQSVVQLMHQGPPRKAPDYYPTTLMSAILGGGFTSRINMNIREKHGYAYGAGGGFIYNRNGSVLRIGASVRTDVTKESIQEMLKEMRGISKEAPGADELVREKNGKILALPSLFATGTSTLAAFRELIHHDLPLDTFDNYVPRYKAVDPAAVQKAAARHVKPGDLRLLIIGDGKLVLPKLKELAESDDFGRGKVIQIDPDGNPLAGS